MDMYIYLCGSVKKGDYDKRTDDNFWTIEDEAKIIAALTGHNVHLLNPSKTEIRRNDYYSNYGCDLLLVSMSDVIFCDARTNKGIGIGAELMFAAYKGIPVVTLSPHNSHYRKDFVQNVFGEDLIDWVHPFIFGLSDYIVDKLEDGIKLLKQLENKGLPKRISTPDEAICHFQRKKYGEGLFR